MNIIDGGGAASVATLSVDGGPAGQRTYAAGQGGRLSGRAPHLQGDPRLIMGPDGTRLQFVGGQPLMDAGLENLVLISLFTNKGWCGNAFMKSSIGSDFEEACNQPITLQTLNRVRMAAEAALSDPALGPVSVGVTNPTGNQLRVRIVVQPPASRPQELLLTRSGTNWQAQASTPAYLQIREERWTMQSADPMVEQANEQVIDGGPALQ